MNCSITDIEINDVSEVQRVSVTVFRYAHYTYNSFENSYCADSAPLGCSRKICIYPYIAITYTYLWVRLSATGHTGSGNVYCV